MHHARAPEQVGPIPSVDECIATLIWSNVGIWFLNLTNYEY